MKSWIRTGIVDAWRAEPAPERPAAEGLLTPDPGNSKYYIGSLYPELVAYI